MGNILKVLFFILLVISLPLAEIARIDLGNNVAVSLLDLTAVITGLFGLILILYKKQWKTAHLIIPISVFIFCGSLSLLINSFHLSVSQMGVAFLYLVRFTLYAGIYFAVRALQIKDKRVLRKYMIVSGIGLLVFGYLQYFFYPALRNLLYLGWDEHLFRMFGSFFDPNFLGVFLVLYLLFLLPEFIQNLQTKNSKQAFLFGLLIAITSLAIFLTYSRSALVALVTGMIVLVILLKRYKVLLTLIVLLGIGLSALLLVSKHSEGTNLLRSASIADRFASYQAAIAIFQKDPIIGVGFNAYRFAQQKYGYLPKDAAFADHAGSGSDNSWLFVLATTGVIGFLSYIYLWLSILDLDALIKNSKIVKLLNLPAGRQGFYIVAKNKKESGFKNREVKKEKNLSSNFPSVLNLRVIDLIPNSALVSSSIALFVGSFFINALFYPPIMVWMWVLIGITE